MRDKHLAPSIRPTRAPMGVYVDNVHTFGGQSGDAVQRMDKIASHFKKLNIPFEVDHVAGQGTLDTLGLTFDLENGVRVRGRSDRVWKLWAASRAILRRRRVSGATLRKWLGHVNYHFLLCRPMLSVLSATYKFCMAHLHHRFPMWPSVRKEIKLVMNLLFLVEKHLSVPVNPEVHVGDSSDKGYGLMYCRAEVNKIREELKYQEKWRFLTSNEPSSVHFNNGAPDGSEGTEDDSTFAGTSASAGVGLDTQFGKQLVATLTDRQQQLAISRKKRRLFGKPSDLDTTYIEVPGIPEVSSKWGDPTLWTLVTAKAWDRVEEHINIKEARVALMALRRLCRSVDNMDTMALTLTDSMVTAMALERGRSSSAGINNVCRRAAAYQVGCNVQFRMRHVRTNMNVADVPSRQFGEDLPRVLRRRAPEDSLGVSIHADSMEQCRQPASSSRPGRREGTVENQQFFLELFSGCGNLTQAVKEVGLLAMPPFDILNGDIYNLLDPGVQDFIMGLLISGNIWWVHLGTPCTVWSRARHNIKSLKRARQKERQGVAFALFTCRVIRECLKRNIAFTLENPKSSRLWQFSPLAELMKDRRVGLLEWDMCQYGENYKKSTCMLTNELGFQGLAVRCQGGHKHEHLQGTVRVKIDLYPNIHFALIDNDCLPLTLFEITELWHLADPRVLPLGTKVTTVESASRDGEPPVEEGNAHPHKRARRDPCPGTLPPQGVILFTEPHSELNAGLVVVCASRHQPILDLAKLDIPVIKDAEAWGRLQTYGTSALRGYRHLMKGYLSTCLDPEGMPSEVASTWIQTGLALTPFAFAETRFSVDWALAWALIGEWTIHHLFPPPKSGKWPRNAHVNGLEDGFHHRSPSLVTWARACFEQSLPHGCLVYAWLASAGIPEGSLEPGGWHLV